jgi:hypothetical protein
VSKPLYSIRDWDEHFEVSQSRKNKHMRWVSIPTKHDGKSFRRLMLREDGTTIFCAWVLIVQVAAKCPRRGILADEDGPLDALDLHIKTGCSAAVFDSALKALVSKEIGWMLVDKWEDAGSTLPPHTRHTDKTNQPTPLPPEAPADGGSEGGQAGGDCVDVPKEPLRAYRPPADDLDAANGELLTLAKSPQRLAPAGWGAVADALTGMGASQWRKAIQEAKDCGCTPGVAMDLINHAKQQGYGAGAIICRLAKARPTLAVDVGWPQVEVVNEVAKQAAISRAEKDRRTAAADKIIIAMRKCQQSDDAIRAALTAKGLEWPK